MNTASLGRTVLIAQMSGDRPAIITKVFSNSFIEACAFTPLPEHMKLVTLHDSRAAAITAGQRKEGAHAYWPPRN